MTNSLLPQVPSRLNALAREVLEALKSQADAAQIVLGGGVALQHYCEFRDTRDLDAWWVVGPEPATEALLETVLTTVGARHGLALKARKWGETQSYELQQSGKTVFGFQIAVRTRSLEPALASAWAPVQIETFWDNLGSKMNALVSRGAPRDFLDVHEVADRGLASVEQLWSAWQRKNPDAHVGEAGLSVLRHLSLLETRRPLGTIGDLKEREQAGNLRAWVRTTLCFGAAS